MQTTEEVFASLDELVTMIPTLLNEKQRRLVLGKVADAYGYGGMSRIQSLIGTSIPKLRKGKAEANELIANVRHQAVQAAEQVETQEDQHCEASSDEQDDSGQVDQESAMESDQSAENSAVDEQEQEQGQGQDNDEKFRSRAPGGGRKLLTEKYPGFEGEIEKLIDGNEYGSPMKVLHWIPESLSQRKMADELSKRGFKCSHETVGKLLGAMGYSKQVNLKKLRVEERHPERDAQFQFINDTALAFLKAGDPVISIDSKKRENVGNAQNDGKNSDTLTELGKVTQNGIYFANNSTGFLPLGMAHDSAEFAVESILRWWNAIGKGTFPSSKRLYITCNRGESDNSRCRLWQSQIQTFCNITGLEATISHYPLGSYRWGKIAHRLFCYITRNWQGMPLTDIDTVIDLIANPATTLGLAVRCALDEDIYQNKITDKELETIELYPCGKFGKWNYTIMPQT